MGKNYSEYLSEGTKAMQEFLSSTSLDDKEKNAFADAFVSELANNISDTDKLRDYNYIFNMLYIKFIDDKLNNTLLDDDAKYDDIENAIKLCDEYEQLFHVFSENKWKVPKLNNSSADNYRELLKKKQNAKSLAEEIASLDKQINLELVKARTEVSSQKCNEAIKLLGELDEKIKFAKRNRVLLPEIKYSDPQKTIKKVIDFRKICVQKEALHLRISQIDEQLSSLISLKMINRDDWQEIINLSEKQLKLLADSDKNHWPRPALKNEQLNEINNQYNHYQQMAANDNTLIAERRSLNNKNTFKHYMDTCSRQQANINICLKNGWDIPNLEYPEPSKLAVIVRNEQKDSESRQKLLRKIIISGVLAIIVIGGYFFGRHLMNSGKIQMPFDSAYSVGQSYELIYSELESAGFTNITKQDDSSGWLESGLVTGVSADNTDTYKKGKYLKPDASIVINISSKDRIDATEYLKTWQTENYKDFQKKLENAGFSNISVSEEETNEKNKDDLISSLKVNGLDYLNEYCFIPKKAPINITCYSLKIAIGNSLQEFIGQDYEDVVANLKEFGFIDVKTEKISSGMAKGNSVVDLTVNSVNTYKNTDTFEPDAKIVVKYSSDDRLDATDILEKWKNQKYQEIEKALKERGFTNISVIEFETEEAPKDDMIESIMINDNPYDVGDCYIQKATPINIIYRKYKITIGKASDALSKVKYDEFVSELKAKGFTDIKLLRADDLKTGWLTGEGTIASVSIGDKKSFAAEDTFYPNDQITIIVHTFKGRGCEDITEIAN